jgi:hypothetical protein
MAAFIAARLNYVLPECNSGVHGGKPVSTIHVDQHKEKFWYVRVYCRLADDSLVTKKWLAERRQEADGEVPSAEFRERCLHHDAIHYRVVHRDMARLVHPRLHKRILSQADYFELLYDDVNSLQQNLARMGDLTFFRERWKVGTDDELKFKLAMFYQQAPKHNDV